MILCSISQFSSSQAHLGSHLIAQYQITSDEIELLQTIYDYENRQNDENLVFLIDRYERLFDTINVTRLVALKLLGYHPQVAMLPFDPTLLASYQTQQRQTQQLNLSKTMPVEATASNLGDRVIDEQDIDPVLRFAAGNF